MEEFYDIFKRNPQELKDRLIVGSFSNAELYKIVDINYIPGDSERVKFSLVNTKTNQFLPLILEKDDLKEIKFALEFNFSGDPHRFFMHMMGNAIRSNFNQDPLFAVGSSKIDPLPHQLLAVYKYILPRPNIRFMIADEPGAGKTIMGGLVIKELLSRGAVKRILIVVPGSLTGQWQEELKIRFNEDFTIVNSEILQALGPRAWTQFDKIITSMDFAKNEVQKKRQKGKRIIRNSLLGVKWDLLIVDEAHKMNAEWIAKTMRQKITRRYQLGQVLSESTDHFLFLTATPHKGKSDSFRLLLKLLEPDSFDTAYMDINSVLNQFLDEGYPIFIRRLKEEMRKEDNTFIFPPRDAKTITFTLSPLESVLYQQVTDYVRNIFNLAIFVGGQSRSSIGFMLKLLQRRLNSSVRAIHLTLIHRKEKLEEILNNPDFDKSIKELRFQIEKKTQEVEEAELNDDIPPKKVEELHKEIFCLTMASNRTELETEINKLKKLILSAAEAETEQCESKLYKLLELIEEKLGSQQLIIFTEYKDTLDYLLERIPENFSKGIIHGGMNLNERKIVQEKFWRKDIQILLCTDAASEGINLQCCWNLINYDIPWNPTRLEQRMGRIHRYLQDHECTFFNLVAIETSDGQPIAEGQVVELIFKKLDVMREELGGTDRVFDVIGNFFEECKFGELLTQSLNKEPIDLTAELNNIDNQKIKDLLDLKSNMDAGFDFFIRQRQISEDSRLWPRYISEYVRLGFWDVGSQIQVSGKGPFKIQVPPKIYAQIKNNEKKFGLISNRNSEITFYKPIEKQLLQNVQQYDYITAGHPLLEAIIDISIKNGEKDIQKGTIFLDPSHGLHGLLWFIEIIFNDGTGAKEVSRQVVVLFTSYTDINNGTNDKIKFQVLSPQILWDLRNDFSAASRVQMKPYLDFFSHYKEYVVEGIGSALCKNEELELNQWRQKAKKIKMNALEHREIRERSRLEAEISLLLDKEAEGEDVEQKILEKEVQRDNIREEIKELKTQIERECSIIRQSPRLISVAIIVPAYDDGKPAENIEEATQLADKHAIDMAAMKAVFEFEKGRGWEPMDKSLIKCGYDIESINPNNPSEIRHIEVKGHTGEADVFISKNEWMKAQNDVSGRYWLYIVNKALDESKVVPISDPANKFQPEKIITERFKIPLKQIKEYY